MSRKLNLNLKLAVRATEDPQTVIWAILGPDNEPCMAGTFPRLPGPPAATIRALCEALVDLMGLSLAAESERVACPSRSNPEAN